ncbi:MAG: hypothetical protein QNJ72_21595 [Pleurocapsa sp. MO_226.B13]|nr:hypothetical protein [Pleurocapsa sp. MO_226.B13]
MLKNHKSLEDFDCVSDEKLFSELNANEASQIAGGQFTVVLEEIGQIPLPESRTQAVGPNPTAIQILNETSLTLNYGLVYDTFSDNTIAPDETQTFFGQQQLAAAGWDSNLARSGIQLDLELLKPEFQYAFRIV